MCLLTALFHVHPDAPLVIAANRDEWLNRPASPLGVLRRASPRILGGRDHVANGTWLAVNEHGVIAGLTNKPLLDGADKSKRSRGELPLLCTHHSTAVDATMALAAALCPTDFNPCWVLVGDTHRLFYIDMTTGDRPLVRELTPGITVLENRPVDADSAKASWVRGALDNAASWHGEVLVEGLAKILGSHTIPETVLAAPDQRSEAWRPTATEAACVHAGPYGTRSASIIMANNDGRPLLWHAEGPPCTTPLVAQALWS
ncbi:MAG: hypothetical protein A2289_11995 [Deltaproteobacteria bacterium RIFOXYA12_FULL_58_15]|nr:MAG: hypothetical protein A2289_11995 [Deltaproteobacteria bacterium RIFOXYA12_FULL_58_15]OGR07890.1 MAG: hypothetical protein A2341_19455 [Deltaproteobacteria bacterium RIFOXYB12_FULL_58_9]